MPIPRKAAAFLLALLPAAMPAQATAGEGEACRDQAAIAERSAGIPQGLLLAIGKRESGRFDPQIGGTLPWPWAVNREGEGHLFESRAEAVAYVVAAQRQGSTSIDIGCFQINLKFHPLAFSSVDAGFDPAINARYAARFLTELHDQSHIWETAVADYLSASPLLGLPYQQAVYATWHGLPGGIPAMPSGMRAPSWEPLRVAFGIRVWTPGGAAPVYQLAHAGGSLPRVITPSVRIGG